jgi:hypothetical protein
MKMPLARRHHEGSRVKMQLLEASAFSLRNLAFSLVHFSERLYINEENYTTGSTQELQVETVR